MIDLDLIPYEVVDHRCGKVAFYLRRKPEPYTPRRSEDVILLNGDRPRIFTACRCGSCGEVFAPRHDMIRERVTA